MRPRRERVWLFLAVALVGATTVMAVASAGTASKHATIKVGLITKDVTNPFFVKMKQGATAAASKAGAQLIYAAGKSSSDNASQIAAIENMTTAGVKGILITVADGKAENPAIAKARTLALSTTSADPNDPIRQAALNEARALKDQMVALGNTRVGDQYIFGGDYSTAPPFQSNGTYLPSVRTSARRVSAAFPSRRSRSASTRCRLRSRVSPASWSLPP